MNNTRTGVTEVATPAQARELAAHLLDPDRDLPVVVISTAGGQARPYVDARDVARRTVGSARVYVVAPGRPSQTLSDQLPDKTQVFGGASRVYPVDLAWKDDPYRSRLHFAYRPDVHRTVADHLTREALAAAQQADVARYCRQAGPNSGDAIENRLDPEVRRALQVAHHAPAQPQCDAPTPTAPPGRPPRPRAPGSTLPPDTRADQGGPSTATGGPERPVPAPRRPVPGPRPGAARPPAPRPGHAVGDQLSPAVQSRLAELARRPEPTAPVPPAPPGRPATKQACAGPNVALADPVVTAEPGAGPDPCDAPVALKTEKSGQVPGHSPVTVELAQLRRRTEELQQALTEAQSQRDMLQRQLGEVLATAAAASREYDQDSSFPRGDIRFEDPLEQFRFEVYEAWAYRTTPQEKSYRPLAQYRVGPDFFATWEQVSDGISRAKVIDVIVDVLTGRDWEIPGREVHQLRTGNGGDDPPVVGPRGETCWRVALQVKTPSARRLHYWRNPDRSIELSSVRLHDDMTP